MTPPTVHSPARWALALLLAVACLLPAHAARLALVIGNKDYAASPLKNPLNDAEAMASALGTGIGGLGFKVTLVRNLRRDDIGRTVEAFANTIRPGDDVVVFYAGHGLQVKGVNYLPAVDARIQVESDVALNSLNLNDLLQRLDEAKAGVRLLLIDACRDNPYSRGFRSSARGLARVEGAPSGTLMHFATRPGSVADDGKGSNGLYTSELLKHLRTPGLPVESMLKRVASGVRQASSGNQQPWTEGALDGEFFFAGAAAFSPAPQLAPASLPAQTSQPSPMQAAAQRLGTTTAAEASTPSPAPKLIDDRYRVLGDGSEVKDVQTGLVWARCSVGQSWDGKTCAGKAKIFAFDDAQKLAGNGWRLPKLRELAGLIYCSSGQILSKDPEDGGGSIANVCAGSNALPTIRNGPFPNAPMEIYWSSSPYAGTSSFAWSVYFDRGNFLYNTRGKFLAVRLVRASE